VSQEILTFDTLLEGKKIYFASDFHLGSPNYEESRKREDKIITWLNEIENSAEAIFLVGDIFDFWFEYKYVVPKGYIRILGKLASLRDKGVPVYFFTGNHDMWMFDYFEKELGIRVFRDNITLQVGSQKIFIGHGDGLGPGDKSYKFIKAVFSNKVCQRLFAFLHPYIGFSIATNWSKSSRSQSSKADEVFYGEKESLIQFCKTIESKEHFDYYLFGHRHLAMEIDIAESSQYINIGEWFKTCSYVEYDGKKASLMYFNQ